MSNFLHYALAFACVLGVLVVVHEFGHYLVARLCGVKVLRFSVGFGRPLLSRRYGRDQTEWALGAIPFGGYVKMLDEREAPVAAEDLLRAFNRQPVLRRMAIVVAGPLANLVLAVLLYWVVFMHGTQELRPLLGTPPAATAAARAGIENGERIVRLDGVGVGTWEDVRWLILQRAAEESSVRLETENERGEIGVHELDIAAIRESGWEGDAFAQLGLTYYRPQWPAVVGSLVADGAAARAGLRPGDEIVAIDGTAVVSWQDVVQAVREAPQRALRLRLRREGAELEVGVTPDAVDDHGRTVGRIGIVVRENGGPRPELTVTVRYGIVAAFGRALHETWEKSLFSVEMIGRMITGEVSWHNLSGPVTIADYAGQSAKLGLEYYLKFMALVSISLGVLNLLPIPILDGGHLLYYLLEIIKRGPVSERTMEIGQQIGMTLLLMLMAFAFYNDIHRLISG